MAIISSSLDESNIPRSRKELRLIDSKIIAEEKINKNLNSARPIPLKNLLDKSKLNLH